uniref:non-specific serine/threonine protein kinase n=1 Tax=Oryza sativa subsp. japonica TaxID=39947 RepID=Q7XX88_ORYSJ|nr:OSJNBa0074B10.18 [Oryza sativa Japonica Group]
MDISHLLLRFFLLPLLAFSLDDAPHLHYCTEAAPTTPPPPPPPPPFSFKFDFSNTYTYRLEDLRFEGTAAVHGATVDLTCNVAQCTTGRMSYGRAVPLWDRATNEVASFATDFVFKIVTPDNVARGDGMAFFLSSYPSRVPPKPSGQSFGLIAGDANDAGDGPDRFVAVEFDTYDDTFERPRPAGDHIGIDVSSVADSINTTSLNFSRNGAMRASITFDMSPGCWSPPCSLLIRLLLRVLPLFSLWKSISTHRVFLYKRGENNLYIQMILCEIHSILSWWKWRSSSRDIDKRTGGVRQFKYNELAAATNQFSSENRLIGAGPFGEGYKGFFKEMGRHVAIKKISKESRSEGRNKDFYDEVKTISSAKHKNLVELVGWCMKRRWNMFDFMCWCREKAYTIFLVYEFVDNSNLRVHLHEKEAVLPWTTRYKIVKDICAALVHLHHERRQFVLHRNIKPNNILLDKEFNAKLADFGLSRTADKVGKARYMDPECRKTGKFKRSSDVYSFGIVLLEIACKKDENSYAKVWSRYLDKSLMQVADDRLRGEFDERQMERVIVLGLWCCQPNIDKRPTMQQAMDFLESDGPLPELAEPGTSSSKIGN